jgi:DNA polymerase
MREAVQGCRGCDLYKHATQAVFGEGSSQARILMIGEQPGDREDREGHPFVGPAGQLLDRALHEAGISQRDLYVTNAVKHFKWAPRGKRRLHQKPNVSEIKACRPWLEAEVDAIRPELIVALGASAAQAVFGHAVVVGELRSRIHRCLLGQTLVTIHPSAILRIADENQRRHEFEDFVDDLRMVAEALNGPVRRRSKSHSSTSLHI